MKSEKVKRRLKKFILFLVISCIFINLLFVSKSATPIYAINEPCGEIIIDQQISKEGNTMLISENENTIHFSLEVNENYNNHYIGVIFDEGLNSKQLNNYNKDYANVFQVKENKIEAVVGKSAYYRSFIGKLYNVSQQEHIINVIYLGSTFEKQNSTAQEQINYLIDNKGNKDKMQEICSFRYKVVDRQAPEVPLDQIYSNCKFALNPPDQDIKVGHDLKITIEGIPEQQFKTTPLPATSWYSTKESTLILIPTRASGTSPTELDLKDNNLVVSKLNEGTNQVTIPGSRFTQSGEHLLLIKDRRGDYFQTLNGLFVNDNTKTFFVEKAGCYLPLNVGTEEENGSINDDFDPKSLLIAWLPDSKVICQVIQDPDNNPDTPNEKKNRCEECIIQAKIWTAAGCIGTDISSFVGSFFNVGLGLAGGIAFLFLIYGGFLYLTSAGNPETLQKAKEIIVSAITGLLLIIFSVFLLRLIASDILKIPGFNGEGETTVSPGQPQTFCCTNDDTLNIHTSCPAPVVSNGVSPDSCTLEIGEGASKRTLTGIKCSIRCEEINPPPSASNPNLTITRNSPPEGQTIARNTEMQFIVTGPKQEANFEYAIMDSNNKELSSTCHKLNWIKDQGEAIVNTGALDLPPGNYSISIFAGIDPNSTNCTHNETSTSLAKLDFVIVSPEYCINILSGACPVTHSAQCSSTYPTSCCTKFSFCTSPPLPALSVPFISNYSIPVATGDYSTSSMSSLTISNITTETQGMKMIVYDNALFYDCRALNSQIDSQTFNDIKIPITANSPFTIGIGSTTVNCEKLNEDFPFEEIHKAEIESLVTKMDLVTVNDPTKVTR